MVWTLCPFERSVTSMRRETCRRQQKHIIVLTRSYYHFFEVKSNTFPYHTHLIQDMSSTTSYNMKKRTDEKKPKAPGTNIRQAFCQVTKIWDSSHPASANDNARSDACLQHIGTIVRDFCWFLKFDPPTSPVYLCVLVQIFSKGAPYHDPHLVAGC